jgi:hypothetical protein
LPGYTHCDWDDLCDDLREEYVDPTPQGRYSKQKLQDFTSHTACTLIADEQAVLKYYRSFNKLSKPLLDYGRITQGKRDATFCAASTQKTARRCMNVSLPSSRTSPGAKPSTTKTSSRSLKQFSQVTMTFFYRSCPLNITIPTAHENKGQSTMVTIARACLCPSKVKSQATKRLCSKTKMITSYHNRGTSTHCHVSRRGPFNSKD